MAGSMGSATLRPAARTVASPTASLRPTPAHVALMAKTTDRWAGGEDDPAPVAPEWVRPVMRAGYVGRGVVYALVGVLTLFAAWEGGETEDAQSALTEVRDMPLGPWLIGLVALALLSYALYRAVNGWMDLDRYGSEAKGLFARGAMLVVAAVHVGLAGLAAAVALRLTGGKGETGINRATATIMDWPLGRWLVGGIGLAVVGAGLYYLWKGFSEDYREQIVETPLTRKLSPVLRFGLIAHGAVIALVGLFFLGAAWNYEPSQAGGLGQAFDAIRDWTAGRLVLALTAIGFVAFAVVCWVYAAHRIVPARVSRTDRRKTLAGETAAKVFRG